MQTGQQPNTYLNYRNTSLPVNGNSPQMTSLPSRPPPPPPSAPTLQSFSNTLLIYISDAPSPDISVYLSTVFTRFSISEVIIIATNDESLKVSKMDVYTAAGKMKQDILVTTFVINAPLTTSELAKATQGLESKILCGVLCCQHSDAKDLRDSVQPDKDILDYDEAQLEASWRASLLTLHTLARTTIPLLRKAPSKPPPFFCLDSTIQLSQLDTIVQDALLDQLSASPASQGLRFGSAKDELVPAPITPPLALDIPTRNQTGNGGAFYAGMSATSSPGLGESPTKLWASWAMMNE